MQFIGSTNEYLRLINISSENCHVLKEQIKEGLSILWNLNEGTCLRIDGINYCLSVNELVFLTEFHKVEVVSVESLRMVQFNRPFYCIKDHDSEVGCKGILFFGASTVPVMRIPAEQLEQFEILWQMFSIEMESKDKLQIEMLQMMLKRLIILCTRLVKEQTNMDDFESVNLDLFREFNFLVETHFKEKHNVNEYADLLYKSPKTLANLFAKNKQKSPLQIIQARLMIEARRLLAYTDLAIKEVAYEIGFESIQSFSRFFKGKEGQSPKEYREKTMKGKIVNTTGNPA